MHALDLMKKTLKISKEILSNLWNLKMLLKQQMIFK